MIFKEIKNLKLLDTAKTLSNIGTITSINNGFLYLNISDDFIHTLFPLINEQNIFKPNYFNSTKTVGAHVSIVYPGETVKEIILDNNNKEYTFTIESFCVAIVEHKNYFVLKVNCPRLRNIRASLDLQQMPTYKNIPIPAFHITIAKRIKITGSI